MYVYFLLQPVHRSKNTKWLIAGGVTLLSVVIIACTVITVVHISTKHTKLEVSLTRVHLCVASQLDHINSNVQLHAV